MVLMEKRGKGAGGLKRLAHIGSIIILFSFLLFLLVVIWPNGYLEPVLRWLGGDKAVIVMFLFLAGLLGALIHRLPGPYEKRPSNEQLWRQNYETDFDIADRVLSIFCDAFMFKREDRYRFLPQDRLMDVYNSGRTFRLCDQMEFEHFIIGLENEFNIKIDDSEVEEERLPTLDDCIRFILSSRRAQEKESYRNLLPDTPG